MAKKTENQISPTEPETVVSSNDNQTVQGKEYIQSQIMAQKKFFRSNTTKPVSWRLKQLKNLYSTIKKYEESIVQALKTDLAKSEFESYTTEIGQVLHEITIAKNNLKKWAKPRKVSGDLLTRPAKSKITPEPFGTVLIISPWNYPFLLSMQPLVSAIASGNTCVLKPSESSAATNKIIETIIQETFAPEFVFFVSPEITSNQILLREQFDFIFFTGSPKVGKIVMENAARNLTPVCLELGGKNPCIVDETANIALAARRIVCGKFLNAGQTCVAPDYILVHESVKTTLIKSLLDEIEVQYGENPLENENYPKIINAKHFSRLYAMAPDVTVDTTTNKISPKIIDLGNLGSSESTNHPTMKEEIFGPLLPVVSYSDINSVVDFVYEKPSPLALYLFSKQKYTIRTIFNSIRFGGGCLNDVVYHLSPKGIPFGGIGSSGMGNYHGEYGFKTFTHYKPIMFQSASKDSKYRYNQNANNLKAIKKILK